MVQCVRCEAVRISEENVSSEIERVIFGESVGKGMRREVEKVEREPGVQVRLEGRERNESLRPAGPELAP